MNSQSGYTFVDDSQLSVCEKINKYFAKKTSVSIINESESDSSVDSFSHLDESFADLLNSNAHVTLMRKSKKEKDFTTTNSFRKDESHIDLAGPNDFKSHTSDNKWINHEDSFQCNTNNWWDKVTDESFLEIERQCNAAYGDEQKLLSLAQNDTTLLFDIEEPSFLDETSICGRQSMSSSMLSPMKQLAMRRPSTILEESTIRSFNSNNTSSDSSSLIVFEDVTPVVSTAKPNVTSYRPSLVNVFPVGKRKVFYNDLESVPVANVSSIPTSSKCDDGNQDNSICLMTFNDSVTEETGSSFEQDDDTHDQFNDTLEAVDYYMEQGKKLMDKTIVKTPTVKTPTVKTPKAIFSPKNRNNSLLKHTLAKRHLRSISGDSLNMSFLK